MKKSGFGFTRSRAKRKQQIIVAIENHSTGGDLVAAKFFPLVLINKVENVLDRQRAEFYNNKIAYTVIKMVSVLFRVNYLELKICTATIKSHIAKVKMIVIVI